MNSTNPFQRLREMLAPAPLVVGTVTAINADGSSTVTFPGGAQQRARGSSVAVGSRAYVRDGAIEGPAPTGAVLTIEV